MVHQEGLPCNNFSGSNPEGLAFKDFKEKKEVTLASFKDAVKLDAHSLFIFICLWCYDPLFTTVSHMARPCYHLPFVRGKDFLQMDEKV